MALTSVDQCWISAGDLIWVILTDRGVSLVPPPGMLLPVDVPAQMFVCLLSGLWLGSQILLCVLCCKYVREIFSSMWYLDLSHTEFKTAEQSPVPDLICAVYLLAKEKAGVRNISVPSASHREI